jgi:shikimate dehydrogenase
MNQIREVRSALILGTGGASKAVSYALEKTNISVTMVSRSNKPGCIAYADLDKKLLESVDLIVNTTPLGTFPDVNNCPDIPYMYLSGNHLVYDLVYNPEKTELLKRSEKHGARIINGYRMLVEQAEEAWKIWNFHKF